MRLWATRTLLAAFSTCQKADVGTEIWQQQHVAASLRRQATAGCHGKCAGERRRSSLSLVELMWSADEPRASFAVLSHISATPAAEASWTRRGRKPSIFLDFPMCYLVKVGKNGVFRARFHARLRRAAAPQPDIMRRIQAYRRDQRCSADLKMCLSGLGSHFWDARNVPFFG